MTRLQALVAIIAAAVMGAGLAVAFGAFRKSDEDELTTASASTGSKRTTPRAKPARAPAGCLNLRLSKRARAQLERQVFRRDAVKGSVYYGACNGRFWSMASFEGGGDGVFKDVRSASPGRLGTIVEAKCKVPKGLLKLWRRDPGCVPDQIVREPAPPDDEPPAASREQRCKAPAAKVPNYNPTDNIPDQGLPSPEELLPDPTKCPEAYEGTRSDGDYPAGDSRRRYPNGRTYIEQVNWCNLMRDQGVYCTVPVPP